MIHDSCGLGGMGRSAIDGIATFNEATAATTVVSERQLTANTGRVEAG